MRIVLNLDLQEINGLLNVLGQLPTSTNIWPLAAKIRQQAQEQLPPEDAAESKDSPGLTE